MLHILGQGGILESTATDLVKHSIAWFFEIAAYCAVNCFALISGYVGVKSKFKYRNLIRLWLQAVFYSAGISVIFYLSKPDSVNLQELIRSFFPICTGAYWYLTAYTLMFFVIPQMNFILEKQEKKNVKILLWTFFVLFSLCSLPPIIMEITVPVNQGYSAIWLAYLYIVGGFIRLYGISELLSLSTEGKCSKMVFSLAQAAFGNQRNRITVYAICILTAFLIRTGGHHIAIRILGRDLFCYQFVNYNSPLILLAGIALLDLFSRMQQSGWSALIRFSSPLAFGVYLIHCQKVVWNCFFKEAFSDCSKLSLFVLPCAIIVIPLMIYVVCSVIDYVRLQLFRFFGIDRHKTDTINKNSC